MKNVNEKVEEYRDLAYPHRIGSYYRVRTPEEIKTALMNHGPVVISMTCRENAYISDDTYCYPQNAKNSGAHCVLIVGWNKKGWVIQNSWGKLWGDKGYCYLPYDYPVEEWWGISVSKESPKPEKDSFFIPAGYDSLTALKNSDTQNMLSVLYDERIAAPKEKGYINEEEIFCEETNTFLAKIKNEKRKKLMENCL